MARLPQPGGDAGNWGAILNDYLAQAHAPDGTLKSASVGSSQLANSVQNSLARADSAYQKPSDGVPLSDLKQTDLDAAYAPAALDSLVVKTIDTTTPTAGNIDLAPTYARGVSIAKFTGTDTQKLQAAVNAAQGTVYIPARSARYVITEPILIPQSGTARSIIGLGNGMVEIEYQGPGAMFRSISTNPANPANSPIDLYFENLRIDGYNNTTSDGAFLIDGAYFVNFDRVEVRRFAKAGAVGVDLQNVFSVDFARSNVLSITNGIGLRVGGALQQVTNVHVHDFILQRSAVNLDIQTGISGGGFQADNGAIRANGSAVAVRMQGKFNNVRFGPALHVESETEIATNTTVGFQFSGASLYGSVVRFEGIDFHNIKTLFSLNASAGTLRNVVIDDVYATALAGLAGTAFALTNLFSGIRTGRFHIPTAEYTTLFALTNTEIADPIWLNPADLRPVIGTPSQDQQQRWPVWLLDSAASEFVGASVRLPGDWNAVAIDVLYANNGVGTGDVRLRGDFLMRAGGENLAAPTAGTAVTSTAGDGDLVKTVTLNGSYALTASKQLLLNVGRLGADSLDTLGNDIALVGVIIRRVR